MTSPIGATSTALKSRTIAAAAHLLEDGSALAQEAALALSRIGRGSLGAALIRRAGDDVVLALAHDGALLPAGIPIADAKRSRFVEPEQVPLAQRDVWVDPVASGFVSKKTAASLPVADLLRAFGLKRVMRRHVCIGRVLVGGLIHGRPAHARVDEAALDALARAFTPFIRAHVLLVSGAAPAPKRAASSLTRRQQQIIDLVAQGLTNGQIATRLRIAPDTVKTTLHRLYAAHGARNRIGLVRAIAKRPLLL